MPSLLSFISRYDYLSHPWYQNVGRSLVYTCPPGSKSNGFGDSSEKGSEPNRLVAAFADYLVCETGNSYAGWYAGECRDLLRRDYAITTPSGQLPKPTVHHTQSPYEDEASTHAGGI